MNYMKMVRNIILLKLTLVQGYVLPEDEYESVQQFDVPQILH